jgi:hypothetical protein
MNWDGLESLSNDIQRLKDDAIAKWPQLPLNQQESMAKDLGFSTQAIN